MHTCISATEFDVFYHEMFAVNVQTKNSVLVIIHEYVNSTLFIAKPTVGSKKRRLLEIEGWITVPNANHRDR